ncbi:Cytochrome b5-like protein [Drosera capensis]
MDKVFSFEQISAHNSAKDCWLLINGKVYDVTKFLEEHPGGDDVLLSATGKDATVDFEGVGHSESAKAMLKDYYVGEVDSTTIPEKPRADESPKENLQYQQDNSPKFVIQILRFVVPLVILAFAAFVANYRKSD